MTEVAAHLYMALRQEDGSRCLFCCCASILAMCSPGLSTRNPRRAQDWAAICCVRSPHTSPVEPTKNFPQRVTQTTHRTKILHEECSLFRFIGLTGSAVAIQAHAFSYRLVFACVRGAVKYHRSALSRVEENAIEVPRLIAY